MNFGILLQSATGSVYQQQVAQFVGGLIILTAVVLALFLWKRHLTDDEREEIEAMNPWRPIRDPFYAVVRSRPSYYKHAPSSIEWPDDDARLRDISIGYRWVSYLRGVFSQKSLQIQTGKVTDASGEPLYLARINHEFELVHRDKDELEQIILDQYVTDCLRHDLPEPSKYEFYWDYVRAGFVDFDDVEKKMREDCLLKLRHNTTEREPDSLSEYIKSAFKSVFSQRELTTAEIEDKLVMEKRYPRQLVANQLQFLVSQGAITVDEEGRVQGF